jgi:hypothetical protein
MKATEFIQSHDIDTLVRLTEFCKGRNFGRAMKTVDAVPMFYEQAVEAGWFREDDRSDADLQQKIDTALYLETDEEWKRKLISARGEARRIVYENWEKHRGV